MGFERAEGVYMSFNYDLFSFLPFNRDVNSKNKRKIRKSADKFGADFILKVILTSCISGVRQYYVADGQHRFEILKDMGLPIRFEIVELDTRREIVEYVATLNNTQKSWRLSDYLKAWCSLGIEEYLMVKQAIKKYSMQLSLILQFYTLSQTNRHNGNFKAGILNIPDIAKSQELIETYQACDPYLPDIAEWHLHRKFVAWLVSRRPERQACITMLKANQFPIDQVLVKLDDQLKLITE